MMYFIPWCVFLGIVVFSVPIASMLEKKKQQAAMGPSALMEEEPMEGEAEEQAEFVEDDGFGTEPPADAMAEFEEFQ